MENKISVIVTTYNQEATIGRTLDSILKQKCQWPVEIILGDDCSTDNTRAICQQYANDHPEVVRLFCNDVNKGLIDNYFDCLLKCKGKYIADCAGDDFWTDDTKLQKELDIMESNPEVTLVHTEWLYYDETTGKTSVPLPSPFTTPFTNGREMLPAIITQTHRPVVHLCTAMFRAETILKAYHDDTFMFRNKDFGCEDLQIVAALAHAGTIAYLPDITLHYSIGHTSVSIQPDDSCQFRFVKNVTSLSCYLADKYGIDNTALKPYLSYRLFALAMHAFRAHDTLLRDETTECMKQWQATKNAATKVVMTVMSKNWLWSLALQLRKVVVSVKKLFR